MLREEQMAFEDTIKSFEDDIKSFEDPIYELRLLILFIKDDNLIDSLEKKITMKNKHMSNKEIIYHLQNTEELKDSKITYLLNFTIEKSMQELYDQFDNRNTRETNYYNLNTITNLKTFNIDQDKEYQTTFNGVNSLIVIANNKNKHYIKSKNYLGKQNQNVSKKKHKS